MIAYDGHAATTVSWMQIDRNIFKKYHFLSKIDIYC